jgi:hypothetical protein
MPEQHPAHTDVGRALISADATTLSPLLNQEPTAFTSPVGGLPPPLLLLLRRSTGAPSRFT